MGELGRAGLRLRLPGQGRVVHLEAARLDDAQVGRDPVAKLDLDNVANDELLGAQRQLLSVAVNQGVLHESRQKDTILEHANVNITLIFKILKSVNC